jgi:hypothetical protein
MSKRQKKPHLRPTRKWWAAQISATTTLITSWVSAGAWNKPLTLAAIGLVSQAAIAYLVPNGPLARRPDTQQTPQTQTQRGQDSVLAGPTPATT